MNFHPQAGTSYLICNVLCSLLVSWKHWKHPPSQPVQHITCSIFSLNKCQYLFLLQHIPSNSTLSPRIVSAALLWIPSNLWVIKEDLLDKRSTFNNAFCCIISLLKLTQAPSVLLDCGLEQSWQHVWKNSAEKLTVAKMSDTKWEATPTQRTWVTGETCQEEKQGDSTTLKTFAL